MPGPVLFDGPIRKIRDGDHRCTPKGYRNKVSSILAHSSRRGGLRGMWIVTRCLRRHQRPKRWELESIVRH
ncbi:MAG: hypothetical protein ACI8PT_003621 [Gammaproteobacteria bacterium]